MKRFLLLLWACTSPNPDFDDARTPASAFPAVDVSAEVAVGAPCDKKGAGCAEGLRCCEASIDPQRRTMCLPPGWCEDDDKGEDDE
jgi:hypothetical protein